MKNSSSIFVPIKKFKNMKIKITCILILFAVVSCSTKENKAEDAIKKYLQESMNAPESYESVEFGKLEGGPDIYTMTHSYKEKLESGETVLQQDTFCLSRSCLHAISVKKNNSSMDDLEWAIKWNNNDSQ
jgi:hypothetical protein